MAKKPDTIEPIDAGFDAVAQAMLRADEHFPSMELMTEADSQDKFLFYSEGGGSREIRVFVDDEDTWITQAAMMDVFGVSRSTISEHIINIFASGELSEDSVVRKFRTTAADGKRYNVQHYNLDMILSVGYRTNSLKAIRFRQWASRVLRDYLIKGFAIDDERLKQGKQLFGKDYFDELLDRIRSIRASERRFYQKVTDIYIQCSYDYDVDAELTQKFFAHAQNKLEYAVTGMTAAEIIKRRADYSLPQMGLTTWKNQRQGRKITQADTTVAKNYLTETEISDLEKLVSMFLDYAENLAKNGKRMSMADWHEKLDSFLRFNEYEILRDLGKFRKDAADEHAKLQFQKFKPIQDATYKSDFDKALKAVKKIEAGSL